MNKFLKLCIMLLVMGSCTEQNKPTISVSLNYYKIDSCDMFCHKLKIELVNNSKHYYYIPFNIASCINLLKSERGINDKEFRRMNRNYYLDHYKLKLYRGKMQDFDGNHIRKLDSCDFYKINIQSWYLYLKAAFIENQFQNFYKLNPQLNRTDSFDKQIKDYITFSPNNLLILRPGDKVVSVLDISSLSEIEGVYQFVFSHKGFNVKREVMSIPIVDEYYTQDTTHVLMYNHPCDVLLDKYLLFDEPLVSDTLCVDLSEIEN